ncbi:hypothetical protein EVAR_49192_1 [Eumeta japonica]|uniref:Uncharacterized protein n=1 Tax=Eumeta variegata TaxID=151549 RepID=A0A4C1XRT8_EUMVA|nr:hypothetical protein EVAR_49192_1 [Eumeta japonica]
MPVASPSEPRIQRDLIIIDPLNLVNQILYQKIQCTARLSLSPYPRNFTQWQIKEWKREELTFLCDVFTLGGHRSFEHDCGSTINPEAVRTSTTLTTPSLPGWTSSITPSGQSRGALLSDFNTTTVPF